MPCLLAYSQVIHLGCGFESQEGQAWSIYPSKNMSWMFNFILQVAITLLHHLKSPQVCANYNIHFLLSLCTEKDNLISKKSYVLIEFILIPINVHIILPGHERFVGHSWQASKGMSGTYVLAGIRGLVGGICVGRHPRVGQGHRSWQASESRSGT